MSPRSFSNLIIRALERISPLIITSVFEGTVATETGVLTLRFGH